MRTLIVALIALLASAALAGCADDAPEPTPENGVGDGGDDGDPNGMGHEDPDDGGNGNANGTDAPAEPEQVSVSTTGNYPVNPGFSTDRIEVPAGATVELTFRNEDMLAGHDFVIDGVSGARTATVAAGEEETITFQAPEEPGEHAFFCSIGDHREQGMEGVFAVV